MPTVLTKAYFTDKYFIPNAMEVPDLQAEFNQDAPDNGNKLTAFIERYEKVLLVNALGNVQYQELMANLDATSGKWFDLINGVDYGTDDEKVWSGLKDIIAAYVYVAFLKQDNAQYNTTGIERVKGKNAISVEPTWRLIDYWNEFVQMYQHYECFCPCLFFPFFLGYGTDYRATNYVSLYKYLRDNPTDFTYNRFRFYEMQNVLGV